MHPTLLPSATMSFPSLLRGLVLYDPLHCVHDVLSHFPSIKNIRLFANRPSHLGSRPIGSSSHFVILLSPSPVISSTHGSLSFHFPHSRTPHPAIATQYLSNLPRFPLRPASYVPSHMLYFPTRLTLLFLSRMLTCSPCATPLTE